MDMLLGSAMGTYLKISWRGCDFNQADSVNFEPCDYVSSTSYHDGPVHTVMRSMFINDLILTVGGTVFAIWKEGLLDTPIMMKNSKLALTCGCWSSYRPSLFYISREDGTIEVWDVLKRTRSPIMVQSLSGKTIREISGHTLPLPYNVAAVADHNGSLRTFFLPTCYQTCDKDDLEKTKEYFNREMERIQLGKQWVVDWVKRNASLLAERQAKIEEEARLKQEKLDYLEKLRVEKKRLHEEAMARLTQSNAHQQNVWRERAEERVKKERDLQLTKALMEKKRVRIADLTRKLAPMQALADERESNRSKMINRKRDAEKMFEELVAVLFPETLDQSYKGLTPKEYLSQEFEQFNDLFEMQFTGLKDVLVERRQKEMQAKQDKKPDVATTWIKLIMNGIERGHVMDTSLTSREYKHYQQQVAPQKVSAPVKVRRSQDKLGGNEDSEDKTPVSGEMTTPKVEAAPEPADTVHESVLSPHGPRDDALKDTLDAKLKL